MQAVRKICGALMGVAVLAMSPVAMAERASLLIWPVAPTIQSDQKADALWLENTGQQPVSLQIRVFSWSQSNGANAYSNQNLVMPSPPVANIEPGKKQLVRLIRTVPVAPGTEQAFRVQLDELPSQDAVRKPSPGVGIMMRYSLPLFVYGDGLTYDTKLPRKGVAARENTGEYQLQWRIVSEGVRKALEVQNAGKVHAQLSRGYFTFPSGKQIELNKAGVGTVLPGARMRWPLPAGVDGSATFTATVNGAKDGMVIGKAQ